MKKNVLFLAAIFAFSALIFTSCEKDPADPAEGSILPERFGVEIPSSLSSADKKSASEITPVNGNHIYSHLRTFIHIGAGGANIVRDIIYGIARYNINKPMTLSYTSDEDGRVKNMVVVANPEFEDKVWEFGLTMTDAESESEADGGYAMQIFWNRRPIDGIAILKPYNIDRETQRLFPDAIFRIDYTEATANGYDAEMTVAIADLTLAHPLVDPYSLGSLKMWVGKKGEFVDVKGNSDHPNAKFFNAESGFNWAFVASGNRIKDISTAEVGLPPSNLNESSREILLSDYSIKNVFTNQIYEVWPNIDEDSVNTFLMNTEAPGFFNIGGFVQGGTAPSADYEALVARMAVLAPYIPVEVSTLSLGFKTE